MSAVWLKFRITKYSRSGVERARCCDTFAWSMQWAKNCQILPCCSLENRVSTHLLLSRLWGHYPIQCHWNLAQVFLMQRSPKQSQTFNASPCASSLQREKRGHRDVKTNFSWRQDGCEIIHSENLNYNSLRVFLPKLGRYHFWITTLRSVKCFFLFHKRFLTSHFIEFTKNLLGI